MKQVHFFCHIYIYIYGLLSGSLSLLVYGQDTSNTTIHDGFSVFLSDFERFNDLACLMLWNVVM